MKKRRLFCGEPTERRSLFRSEFGVGIAARHEVVILNVGPGALRERQQVSRQSLLSPG